MNRDILIVFSKSEDNLISELFLNGREYPT